MSPIKYKDTGKKKSKRKKFGWGKLNLGIG